MGAIGDGTTEYPDFGGDYTRLHILSVNVIIQNKMLEELIGS